MNNGFEIFGLDEDVVYDEKNHNAIVAIGDSVTVTCGAYVQNFSQEIEWRKGSKRIVSDQSEYLKNEREVTLSIRL